MEPHPLYRPLSQRGLLDPISYHMTHVVGKPAPSNQHLKQLGQYASSPGQRG